MRGRGEGIIRVLCCPQGDTVHKARAGIGALHLHRGHHQAFDRVGDVMRLVQHMGGVEAGGILVLHQLVEHEEQTVGVDGPGIQIVVAIFAVVEVEAAEFAKADQAGDDLFDVHVGRVVAQIDQTFGLWPQFGGDQVVGAPVLHDGGIEGGFVHLVFGEQLPVIRQALVDGLQAVQIAVELAGEILLAGEVRSIADPDGQGLGAQVRADFDTLKVVVDGLLAGGFVGMGLSEPCL